MHQIFREEIQALEALRHSRVLVYAADDRRATPRSMEEEDVPLLYEALRSIGPVERLDLVVHTCGGRVNVSRKISMLLREFAREVHVLVPYKARSAGTLLCLGANSIVMTPLAELSPVDPLIMSASESQNAAPNAISSETIRMFRTMAEEWFELREPEHRMQMFRLLAERIFPTTLSTFFRADQQTRRIAAELLRFQLPDLDEQGRVAIAKQLISGYFAHDYCISQAEAERIGLRATTASTPEEECLWSVWQRCLSQFGSPTVDLDVSSGGETIDGLIVTSGFAAKHAIRITSYQPAGGAGNLRAVLDSRWSMC